MNVEQLIELVHGDSVSYFYFIGPRCPLLADTMLCVHVSHERTGNCYQSQKKYIFYSSF